MGGEVGQIPIRPSTRCNNGGMIMSRVLRLKRAQRQKDRQRRALLHLAYDSRKI